MTLRLPLCALLAALALPASADDVSDALQAALDGYTSGDLAKASEQIILATQALRQTQAGLLTALLPAAPEGFTREDTGDFAQSISAAGGGTGAEASYSSADGATTIRMSFIADNPMVSSMGAMLGNVAMMAQMGKVVKAGDQALLVVDGSVSGLIANRILFQVQGGTEDQAISLVQAIDFAKLAAFDKR